MNGPDPTDNPEPDASLDGWDTRWSRFVDAPDHTGVDRRWHLLDTGPEDARLTVLAVHGNPTWSYTWRHLAAAVPDDVRVIAPDQLEMGYSERTGRFRRLGDRVEDLVGLTGALGLGGDVVVVAHDWGGPVSLGWLQRTRRADGPTIVGLVLTNTAVHQPANATAPMLIRNARRRWVLPRVTVDTTAFLRGMFELSRPRTPPTVRRGYLAPYGTAERRAAIGHFVEDIPLESDHPSAPVLDEIAAGLADLHDLPSLLVWGAGDQVFSDLYLDDLQARLPHADVHRDARAGHLVSEDIDTASIIVDWLGTLGWPVPAPADRAPSTPIDLTAAMADPALADRPAIHEMERDTSITFGDLDARVQATAEGLQIGAGIAPGDRVALMIPPGIDLAVALYGCWRLGAVPVLIDGGLGPRQMSAAMRVARPDHLIGIPRALAAAKALRWPGARICSTPLTAARRRALGAATDLPALQASRADTPIPTAHPGDAEAAIVFTSGATGPSKGVRYSGERIAAQIETLVERYAIGSDDSLVAAFAPFALYGPAMGITSTVPAMDVAAPGTLTATALLDAVDAVDASLVFASPAAIANVLETADGLAGRDRSPFDQVRLLLSAGAPVPTHLLADAVSDLVPQAAAHTPYGMTECLPVADIDLVGLHAAAGHPLERVGVCVGEPAPGVEVAIDPLDDLGRPAGRADAPVGSLGEVWVRAPHQRLGYERRWHTTRRASPEGGWHATGDLGALDEAGRLWIGGRLGHTIVTAAGPIAPAAIERVVDRLHGIRRCAAVGVGPAGAQVVVVIAEAVEADRRPRQAPIGRIDEIRAAVASTVEVDVAACLEVASLPVDRRHNSKIDRAHLASWADAVLAGGTVKNP
ncbi:MAG: alpha/beta fold hydrolase [Actinomycetota bacterium]